MSLKHLAAAGILAVTTLGLGCDKEPAPATPAATPTMNDKANAAAADVQTKAADAQKQTGTMMDKAADKTAAATADMKSSATDATSTITAQAQKLYEQATSAISTAKFDDAQKYVDQLKALKDKLPAEWQTKVDDVAKMLTDAKAKMANLPAMPSMPK